MATTNPIKATLNTQSALVTKYLCGGTHLSLCLFQFHQGPIAVFRMYEDNWLAMCTSLRLCSTKDADVVQLQIFYGVINVAHLKLTNDNRLQPPSSSSYWYHLIDSIWADRPPTRSSNSTGITCASIQLINSQSKHFVHSSSCNQH